MNASLEQKVDTFSNHYLERFKFLLEGEMLNLQVKRHKDANSIMQEYLCNDGEVENDNYQWLYVNYQFEYAN
mgnify:CR=1 FL=1